MIYSCRLYQASSLLNFIILSLSKIRSFLVLSAQLMWNALEHSWNSHWTLECFLELQKTHSLSWIRLLYDIYPSISSINDSSLNLISWFQVTQSGCTHFWLSSWMSKPFIWKHKWHLISSEVGPNKQRSHLNCYLLNLISEFYLGG